MERSRVEGFTFMSLYFTLHPDLSSLIGLIVGVVPLESFKLLVLGD